jgi:predicted metal-dependent hydrolase
MNIEKAKILAKDLMAKHNIDKEYDLLLSNRMKRTFGYCSWGKVKMIKLSMPLIKIANERAVKNVILHEIAHALTPGHRHNFVWREKLIEIGGDGKRCYDPNEIVK